MDTPTKRKVVAGAAGALALAMAVGAAGAIAAARALDARSESQAVIDDAADQLGVESSDLSDALKQALKNQVDRAVESGRLTEEQGARLKERIDSGETPLIFPGVGRHGGFGPGFGHGFGPHARFGKLETAAGYLGLTQAELREQLREGKTLADVAKAEGKSVDGLVDALVTEAEKKLDEAVEKGRLTEERAAELKAGLEDRMTDLVNGELSFRGKPFGKHGGFFGDRGPFTSSL